MKVKIKSFNGNIPEFLTLGKEYDVWTTSDMLTQGIVDDTFNRRVISLSLKECYLLNGGDWEEVL